MTSQIPDDAFRSPSISGASLWLYSFPEVARLIQLGGSNLTKWLRGIRGVGRNHTRPNEIRSIPGGWMTTHEIWSTEKHLFVTHESLPSSVDSSKIYRRKWSSTFDEWKRRAYTRMKTKLRNREGKVDTSLWYKHSCTTQHVIYHRTANNVLKEDLMEAPLGISGRKSS